MNKKIEDMTPAELRKLADEKEQQEINRIIKVGYAKEDIYSLPVEGSGRLTLTLDTPYWFGTKDVVEELINNLRNESKVIIPKGHKFECFRGHCGEDVWDSVNSELENMEDAFAKEFLENITVLES